MMKTIIILLLIMFLLVGLMVYWIFQSIYHLTTLVRELESSINELKNKSSIVIYYHIKNKQKIPLVFSNVSNAQSLSNEYLISKIMKDFNVDGDLFYSYQGIEYNATKATEAYKERRKQKK